MQTASRHGSGTFIVNFEHISQLFLVFILLHLNKWMFAGLLFPNSRLFCKCFPYYVLYATCNFFYQCYLFHVNLIKIMKNLFLDIRSRMLLHVCTLHFIKFIYWKKSVIYPSRHQSNLKIYLGFPTDIFSLYFPNNVLRRSIDANISTPSFHSAHHPACLKITFV